MACKPEDKLDGLIALIGVGILYGLIAAWATRGHKQRKQRRAKYVSKIHR